MAEKGNRGFALMNAERQREIARMGGKAAHAKGSAHEFTTEEARHAGRKGGLSISKRREHMVEIGRHGGRARRRNRQQAADVASSVSEMSGSPDLGGPGSQELHPGETSRASADASAPTDQGEAQNNA